MLRRRECLLGLAAGSASILAPGVSHASIAYAISLPDLVNTSHHSLVVTPREAYSQWEVVGKSQRLVTYSRVQVEDLLDDRKPEDSELLVRTLGGRVGRIAQTVPGEAQMVPGETSSVFVQSIGPGQVVVTAMSQGHFPLTADLRGIQRLRVSPHVPDLRNAERSAARLLSGRTVSDVRDLVTNALKAGR